MDEEEPWVLFVTELGIQHLGPHNPQSALITRLN